MAVPTIYAKLIQHYDNCNYSDVTREEIKQQCQKLRYVYITNKVKVKMLGKGHTGASASAMHRVRQNACQFLCINNAYAGTKCMQDLVPLHQNCTGQDKRHVFQVSLY